MLWWLLLAGPALWAGLFYLISGRGLIRSINKGIRAYNEDPEVVSNLKSLHYWGDKLAENLKEFCEKNPDSETCKQYGPNGAFQRAKRLREAELKKREKSVLYRFRSFFKDQF